MRKAVSIAALFLAFAAWMGIWAPSCPAHGVVHHVERTETVVVKFLYDDGEPMSYSRVKVFSPGETKIEYQNGRTDKNGCFAFVPNDSGTWRAEVNDGMGHGTVAEITVDPREKGGVKGAIQRKAADGTPDKWAKAVMGVSVIFGLSGILFWWKGRARSSRKQD